MKFENSQELLIKIDYLTFQINQFNHEIEYLKTRKKEMRSKAAKKYINNLIKNYQEKISELKNVLASCKEVLEKNSTFPLNLLIPFLKDVLEIQELNEYLDTNLIINESGIFEKSYAILYKPYYLIYNANYREKVANVENTFLSSRNKFFYNQALGDSKKIMAVALEEESLLDGKELKYNFKDFPYLEEIAYNLVDRRLSEPNKSLADILNDELENIKDKGISKSKTSEIKV